MNLVLWICLEFRASYFEFPDAAHRGRPYRELTAAFLPSSLTRTHPFALVFSTNPPVSVSGTVAVQLTLDTFLGSALCGIFQTLRKGIFSTLGIALRPPADLPAGIPYARNVKSNNPLHILRSVLPLKLHGGAGILTSCPSPAAFAIGLGPTNPPLISIAEEPLGFRRAGISPALRLLVPTFSLPNAPRSLTSTASQQWECSSTTRGLH